MAYVEVHYGQWDDDGGTTHKIKLLQESGSGPTERIAILAPTPCTITRRGGKNIQLENHIYGSELKFNFQVHDDDIATFDAIFESDYKEWKIEHYYNNVLDWVGWLLPDNHSRGWIKKGDYYPITLSATDGLAKLKQIEFVNFSTGAQYTDRVSIMVTLKRALEHVGHELDFRIQLGTNCTNDSLMTSIELALHKVTVDNSRYTKHKDGREVNEDCYTLIEKILKDFNCYLIQEDNLYWIVNPQEKDSFYFSMQWSTITTVDSRTAQDLAVSLSGYKYNGYGEKQKIRPLEVVEATFRDRNVQDNLLSNGDFAVNNTNEWTNGGDFGYFTTVSHDENYELITQVRVDIDGVPSATPNFYSVAQEISVRGESDQIEVRFKLRCTDIDMDVGFSGPSYYERTTVTCRLRKGSPTGSILTSGLPITLGQDDSTYTEYILLFNLSETDYYHIEFLVDSEVVTGAWSDFDLIEVRFDDISITPLYTDGPDITFDSFHKVTNTDSDFIDKFEHEMVFGDSVQDNDIGSFQIGGTRTETWDRFGKNEDTSIQILSAQNIIENFGRYKDYLRFKILDPDHNIKAYNLLNTDSKDYQILSHTVIFAKSEKKHIKVEVAEVLNTAVGTSVTTQLLTTIDGQGSSASTVILYSPSSSVNNQNLQEVTDEGNETTKNVIVKSGSSQAILGFNTDKGGYLQLIDKDGNTNVMLRSYAISEVQAYFTAGNVGFGKSNPSKLIHVFKNVDGVILARFEGAGSDYVDISDSGIDINRAIAYLTNTLTDGDLILRTNNGAGNKSRIVIHGNTDNIDFYSHDGIWQSRIQPVTGNFGSFQIDGNASGGYEGYSIGGRVVFAHDNGTIAGLYDDVNNQWMFKGALGGKTEMGYAGSTKIETTNTGALVTGILNASTNLQENGVNLADAYQAISITNFGSESIKTLSTGVAASGTNRNLVIAAQSGVTDDMIELTGLTIGDKVLLTADTGDTITVKHNDAGATIKILLLYDNDFILDEQHPIEFILTDTNELVETNRAVLEDGSGTTIRDGNKVDLGGNLAAQTTTIRKKDGEIFQILPQLSDNGERQELILSDTELFIHYRSVTGDINMGIGFEKSGAGVPSGGGLYLMAQEWASVNLVAGISIGAKNGIIKIGDINSSGRSLAMMYDSNYHTKWDTLSLSDKNRVTPDVEWVMLEKKELNEWYVKKSGSDTAGSGDGSQGTPYLTITKAITAASADDVIYVGAGTFTESLAISKSLTIIGVGEEVTLTSPWTAIISTITFTNNADLVLRNIYAVSNLVESTSTSHMVVENGHFFGNNSASSITDFTIKNSKQSAQSGVFDVTNEMLIVGSKVILPSGSDVKQLEVRHSKLTCSDLQNANNSEWFFYDSFCEGLLGNTATTFTSRNSKFTPNSIRGRFLGDEIDSHTIRRELTQAEMQALNTTPITLHAIGATSIGEVISIVVINEFNTSAFGAATKLRFKYQTSGTLIGETTTSFVQAGADRAEKVALPTSSFEIVKGEDIIVDADADATGGNANTKVHIIMEFKAIIFT